MSAHAERFVSGLGVVAPALAVTSVVATIIMLVLSAPAVLARLGALIVGFVAVTYAIGYASEVAA